MALGNFAYSLILDLFTFGDCEILIYQSHCPRTVKAIEKILPIRSRGLKRSGKFTITTNLTSRTENEKKTFSRGEVGVDPSSGNITIFLENQELEKPQNLLGIIENLEVINKIKLSQGLEIIFPI